MNVLVFCENSDVVGSAFRARGHDVTSSDLEPSAGSPNHYQGDGRWLLREPWDLVIAHPPCQRLTWLNHTYHLREKMQNWDAEYAQAREFFLNCLQANAPLVAVENPIQHPLARQEIGPYSFLTCPTHFGASYTKRTAFWLKGLPPLMATLVYPRSEAGTLVAVGRPTVGHYGGNKKRGIAHSPKLRAKFHPGMAAAMAQQWGVVN